MFEKELEVDDLGPDIMNLDQDLEDEARYLASQNRTLWSMWRILLLFFVDC